MRPRKQVLGLIGLMIGFLLNPRIGDRFVSRLLRLGRGSGEQRRGTGARLCRQTGGTGRHAELLGSGAGTDRVRLSGQALWQEFRYRLNHGYNSKLERRQGADRAANSDLTGHLRLATLFLCDPWELPS